MDLYSYIIHDPQTSNTFDQFFFFQCMWRPNHHMYFHTAACCPDDALDDNEVLVSFILNKKRMLGIINKSCDTGATIDTAPDKARIFTGSKICSFPVCFKT